MNLASIPSPEVGVWHPFGDWLPIRGYALCIVAGIVLACWLTERRMRQRGAPQYAVLDVAVWAVPFGRATGDPAHWRAGLAELDGFDLPETRQLRGLLAKG